MQPYVRSRTILTFSSFFCSLFFECIRKWKYAMVLVIQYLTIRFFCEREKYIADKRYDTNRQSMPYSVCAGAVAATDEQRLALPQYFIFFVLYFLFRCDFGCFELSEAFFFLFIFSLSETFRRHNCENVWIWGRWRHVCVGNFQFGMEFFLIFMISDMPWQRASVNIEFIYYQKI